MHYRKHAVVTEITLFRLCLREHRYASVGLVIALDAFYQVFNRAGRRDLLWRP